MVDFDALMNAQIYSALGVTCTLTLADSRVVTLIGIDDSDGTEVGNNVKVPTIAPMVSFRRSDLTAVNLVPDELVDGDLEMNGVNWRIRNYQFGSNPSGELSGELICTLERKSDIGGFEQ